MAAEAAIADKSVKPKDTENTTSVESEKSTTPENVDKRSVDGKKKQFFYKRFNKEFLEERRRAWEEAQKEKEVLETNVKGHVKWYSVVGRYGFIERADNSEDVFVHQSVIAKSKVEKYFLRTLDNGEDVEFDIVKGKKGLEASNVTGPENTEVRGSRYFRVLLRQYRPSGRRYYRKRDDDRKSVNKSSVEKSEVSENDNSKPKESSSRPKRRRYHRYNRKDKNGESGAENGHEGGAKPPTNRRRRRDKDASPAKNATSEDTKEVNVGTVTASLGSMSVIDAQV